MKIALLGATGRTGSHVLTLLLDHGHQVVALARDPATLAPAVEKSPALTVFTGDATDPQSLRRLVSDSDAVVSALGPRGRRQPSLLTSTARSLVQLMNETGVRRYVGIGAAGVDAPGDEKSMRDRVISKIAQTLGGRDKVDELAVWLDSGLDWTLVRPPRLVYRPASGRVEHDAHRSPAGTAISYADLAALMVRVLEEDLYLGEAPLVANAT